ncbi:MAG: diacylglycerol kinase [Candidatus Moranbacteria bacterium GW2011_GWE1_49_15]|nr:MAG: diacylglycerol kinase [Candidatus Moranbacteria bacterium GW2011_GWE2_47_10]KKW07029.1 MAG: diacylglycerol kinase [Candidatus Moranbacteria bacterium GW2011_GWE1_49_15]HBP01502.1 diacylglycerol kinase [Candidatus Moranbacteria bacterium]
MVENIRKIARSFSHAIDGLAYAAKRERNFQIELLFGFLVLVLILVFKVKNWEAVVLILMVAGVLITELANTVVERVVDMLKPKVHPYARLIKDIMAAVVLISSFVAALVGVIIFYPYIRELLGL